MELAAEVDVFRNFNNNERSGPSGSESFYYLQKR